MGAKAPDRAAPEEFQGARDPSTAAAPDNLLEKKQAAQVTED